MSARSYDIPEIVSILTRRRWLILLPFAIGIALAPVLARSAPARFRSDAVILIVPQKVPESYVMSTVSHSIEERLPTLTDQILSRSRLERIIQEMDLYKPQRAQMVMEDVVQMMRGDVSTSPFGNLNSFRIGYVSDQAETARKVTERLASLYIEQNLKDRESQADNTSQFLETQLADAKRRLIEQEKKLEVYRRTHSGQLPSQLQGNLQAIQNANLQLQALNESTNRALERRLLIQRQLADVQTTPLPPAPVTSTAESPVGVGTAERLELARAQLAAALQRYTPDHPEVVSLQRTIGELTARMEGETPVGATAAREQPVTAAEAAQRKKIQDLQADLVVIDHQLAANRDEETQLKRTIADYQSKVDILPTRESELIELTRDYSTLQAGYASLLGKREDSVIAANLERRQIGEQFRLLDPASYPGKPYNQLRRVGIMASGAAAGLVLGLMIAGLLEFRDTSFRSREEVMKMLSVPVLASIPIMSSERELQAVRNRGRIVDLAGAAVLLGAFVILVVWRVQS